MDQQNENEKFDGVYQEDKFGLNDGFFSIDEFNKQTEMLELDDTLNPLQDDSEDESNFGSEKDDMALDSPEGENDDESISDSEEDISATMANANDIMYNDFFKPPPRKQGKDEQQSKFLERQKRKSEQQLDEPSIERTMSDVRRDLFEDSAHEDSDDEVNEEDPSDPLSRKSTHERQQAKLMKEIRRLEAASVASREWALSGEARAADRPLNSLLEKELEFERTGKPVPEVTAEVSESIESLIKRRILAQEFDEVIRRRPDDLSKKNVRRGIFELDDNKPQQSLAEIYEEEHIKANNPDTYISKTDEKIKKEEREIEILWKGLSAKLDTLSSWHFKPKPPAPSLTIVSDIATITMEDAQPTTGSGITGSESMLAPQEIYKAGKDKDSIGKDDVVPRSGLPIARQEMTREQKLRRRRRAKEKISKRGTGITGKPRPLQSSKST
ncbi:putative u3 small nucleolar ribonucleoprotein mpp10 [Erysiphe necator]|uniref:Putative u3 small nucleolar ribonucleoprotein mpp10 n=1 Tax=Uncinula necator TaxID=52586 RepID=A0A0B1PAZ8_UNCNE|nr:putative u3 small nucleolar ribonucleoprotein mpp10 [Erysiphe necator]